VDVAVHVDLAQAVILVLAGLWFWYGIGRVGPRPSSRGEKVAIWAVLMGLVAFGLFAVGPCEGSLSDCYGR
jgi:hypothetical protein